MPDVLEEIFSRGTDRERAKAAATEIARLLKSKRVRNKRGVIGSPYCHYKVPLHTEDFWITLFISDKSYAISANHKRPTPEICRLFDLSLFFKKKPDYWGAGPSERIAWASSLFGVPVYSFKGENNSEVLKEIVRSKAILKGLKKVDFSSMTEFHLSTLQTSGAFLMPSIQTCVEQAKLLQNLIVLLFKDSQKRHRFDRE